MLAALVTLSNALLWLSLHCLCLRTSKSSFVLMVQGTHLRVTCKFTSPPKMCSSVSGNLAVEMVAAPYGLQPPPVWRCILRCFHALSLISTKLSANMGLTLPKAHTCHKRHVLLQPKKHFFLAKSAILTVHLPASALSLCVAAPELTRLHAGSGQI